jgi:hypothetical protein
MEEGIALSTLTVAQLKRIATIKEQGIADYAWTQVEQDALTADEQRQVHEIVARLQRDALTLLNEATLWSRAIYPLLMLAEQDDVRAWAQVPLRAPLAAGELQGVADGVLGRHINDLMGTAYYLIVVEAKRGLEATDPRAQLYGQLLAAARLNWETHQQAVQEVFGCYIIGDSWTFLRTVVEGVDTENVSMQVETSREYAQKVEAESILKLLKRIVASCLATTEEVVAG